MAKPMGMEIFAYTANLRPSQESKRYAGYNVPATGDTEGKIQSKWFHGTDKRSLPEFLSQKLDYLLVSLSFTNATRNLLGREEFDILSEHNTFAINVSRPSILDQN